MQKISVVLALAILFLTVWSCQDSTPDNTANTEQTPTEPVSIEDPTGLKLMKGSCYSCHNPAAPEGSRLAPLMGEIKATYLEKHGSKEAFVEAIFNFTQTPNASIGLMTEAIKEFGLMPQMAYPEENIRQIAEYLFDNELKEATSNNNGEKDYKQLGLKYALSTKKQLGKNLMGTLKAKGTVEALTFCNTKAIPLTDSMAKVLNVAIKRVSDKPRSPNNQANAEELKYIENYKEQLAAGQDLEVIIVQTEEGKVHFYYPISTNAMCMQCHGQANEQIKEETLKQLRKLYPNDKAIGYGENQIRGIWSIVMDK
ncbi:MAG: DUF3365 domain-containing protein [Aureispira sp.]|nr:DUF3365 domain-containing protein [Aureispira sp.]